MHQIKHIYNPRAYRHELEIVSILNLPYIAQRGYIEIFALDYVHHC